MSQSKKVVSNKSCKKAMARGINLAPPAKKLKESRKTRELSRNQARENKNYYSCLEEEEEMEIQSEEVVTLERHGINPSWFRQATYVNKKTTLECLDLYEEMNAERIEYYKCVDLGHEFRDLELYGPWRKAFSEGIAFKRDVHDKYVRDQHDRSQVIKEGIKRREVGRFNALRERELRAISFSEACWIEAHLTRFGKYRDVDRYVDNLLADYYGHYKGRKFDAEMEKYDRHSMSQYLGYQNHYYFDSLPRYERRKLIRFKRIGMKNAMDRCAFLEAYHWNNEWVEDDVLECVRDLFVQPILMSVQGEEEEIAVSLDEHLKDMSARERMRYLEAAYGSAERESYDHHHDPFLYAAECAEDDHEDAKEAKSLKVGHSLLNSFSDALKSLTGDTKAFVIRSLDVVTALYNLSMATDKKSFFSLLYAAIRTIFKDLSAEGVVSFGKRLMRRLTTQAGAADVWRYIADALAAMWEGAGTWIACPMVDIVLDLINLLAFCGLVPSTTVDMLDDPKYNVFSRKVKREVSGISDLIGIVIRTCMMAAEVVATYFEKGVLDLFGWSVGSRKEVFADHAALMAERVEASLGLLKNERRGEHTRFKSPKHYSTILDKTIDTCTYEMRKSKNAGEKNIYARMMKELMTVRNELTMSLRCREARIKPFTFSVYGATSSMKSTVATGVWKAIAKENKLEDAATNFATVNFKDEYFSEVHQQEILLMDDFMNEKDTSALKVNPIRILLDWSSNNAVQIPGAAIHEKGVKFCQAKVLGMTCHDREFHAQTMSYQPEAAYRRVEIYIEVVMNPKFRTASGDPSFDAIEKDAGPDACFPDIWFFNCWACKIQGTSWTWRRLGKELMDNDALETMVRDMSRRHFEIQESIVKKLNNPDGWFCPHERLTGACKICRAENVSTQAKEEEEEKVDVANIREMMRSALGSQCEKVTAILFSEMMKWKSMGDLRARVNRCAGECLQSLVDGATVDVDEFVKMFRSKEVFVDGPPIEDLPCSFVREPKRSKMDVQAQVFEMTEEHYYEVITWDELELLYPVGSRREIVAEHIIALERKYAANNVFVSVNVDTYHFELVFTIHMSPLTVQGDEQDVEGPPLPGLEPAGTYEKEKIREGVRKAYHLGYGMPEPTHPLERYRRRAIRQNIAMTAAGTKTTFKDIRVTWFLWQLFSSLKFVIAGTFALSVTLPGLMAAFYAAYVYFRRFGWRSAWRIPYIVVRTLWLEWKGVGAYLHWGEALSNWLDEKWMPANTRFAITVQRAYDAGGAIGAASAVVALRCKPVSAMEIQLGKTRALIVKTALNVAGYIAAAAAAFALYKAFKAFNPIPFLGSAAKKAVAASLPKLKSEERWRWRSHQPDSSPEYDGPDMRRTIDALVNDLSIQDEHFYHIPKERMRELVVNSSEVDYPPLLKEEHNDVWVSVNPGKNHIGSQAKSTHPDVLRQQLETNLRFCTITCIKDGVRKTFRVHALAVAGCDWLVPSHVIVPGVEDYEFLALADKKEVAAPHIKGTFSTKHIQELDGVDFSLVRLIGSLPMTNITKFFPLEEKAGAYAQFFHRVQGVLIQSSHRLMPLATKQSILNKGAFYKEMAVCMMKHYPVMTYQGLCGAVWMGGTEREPFIHSLHICGMEDEAVGGSCVVTMRNVMQAICDLNERVPQVVSAGTFPLEIQAREWEHTLNPRHFLNFIPVMEDEVPILSLVGTHSGHSGKYSQDIRESLIAPALRHRLDWPVVHKPVPHPNSSIHYQHAMKELAYPRNGFVASILDKAAVDFTGKILDHVNSIPHLHEMVRPLPDTAIVSGIDSMVGVDKMNPNTSAGFPERGKKGRFFVPGDEDAPVTVPMTMDEEHLELAAKMEVKLAAGERVYAPFTLSVKIEPTKVTKDHARLFGASNMVFTFVFRKYYLSIFRLIQMQPFHFETALGINCHSADWDQMAKYMEFHDRLIEGDYQTYDKTMGASIILYSFHVLIAIAKAAGYNEQQLAIMRGIATEVAYPTYEARGVLFVAGGSNPSGHPGTFIINCFANSLFMRYAFYWGMKRQGVPLSLPFEKRFDDFVRLVTAGDDHLAGVSPECTWFDQFVVQDAMASIRVGYTDGKKNPVFESAFTHIGEASFVSRGFRQCDFLKRWVAPLAVKSLQKSYMIHNFGDKCPYTPSELIALVVEQNEVELFFHGKEKFEYYYNAVRGAMEDAGLSSWLQPAVTWEEVGELVEERSKPAFYPNLTTQANEEESDEPPRKKLKIIDPHFFVVTALNGKIGTRIENSLGVITKCPRGEGGDFCIQGFKFTATTGSLSILSEYIVKLLANNNNSSNGMTSSANVLHDNPSALSWASSRGSTMDASRELYSGQTDSLATYLERPVLIDQLEWGIGTTLYQDYRILTKILTSPPIKNKLQNFENILFELEIDFEISANPFLYGMLLINWVPFTRHDGIIKDRGPFYEDNVEASQRQRLFIDASTSSGGTMKIPFYWPTNYFNLVKDNPNDFGYLSVRQLNPLMHVSGVNQKVTVYIRAKMTNVRLHTSTSQGVTAQPSMSVQGDESPNDKLSSAASKVASVATSLTPVLGGYATATAAAASSAASILRAMGLSHPRSKEMVHKMENRPLGNMSNYNVPSSAYTLGLDENNEVTIDPQVASLTEDEMSLGYITKKEAFIGTYDWDITDLENSVLATHIVHPYQFMTTTTGGEFHLSPLAYISRMFQFWTGTIRFRFQVVCSKWHRGRLRIIHDPVLLGNITDSVWQTTLQSVVDITDERDFVIDVKYVQGQMWCQTGDLRTAPKSFISRVDASEYSAPALVDANGVLKVVVMNRLVIPDDTVAAPCHINVFVSAGDDFEVNVPIDVAGFTITPPPPTFSSQDFGPEDTATSLVVGGTVTVDNGTSGGRMIASIPMSSSVSTYSPWYNVQGTQINGSLTLKNTGAAAVNVAVNAPGGSSLVNIAAGGTGVAIIKGNPATATGSLPYSYTIGHDGSGIINFQIVGANLPVKPGFKRVSAIDSSYTYLRRDGQQDATSNPTPPPTWPVVFNLTGAPTVYWRTIGSTGLYQPGNNGDYVYVLSKGPVRVNDGVYGPTRVAWNRSTPGIDFNLPDQNAGYSNATFQLSADFAASTTIRGYVYDVLFTIPALTTQADETDEEIADPNAPPTQAVMHDTSVPEKNPFIYFGERILHVRQMIGRPVYHTSYFLSGSGTSAGTLRRHVILETDLPEYAGIDGLAASTSPLYLLMACYNGWRGSIRSKYVFNGPPASLPVLARLERRSAGFNTRSQTSVDYDLTSTVSRNVMINAQSSMWNGAIITNPQLANELHAEFPYYYRYRFRSARPFQMKGRPAATNTHQLTISTVGVVGPTFVDRYYQPGEDFTLLNWVGTPVLY